MDKLVRQTHSVSLSIDDRTIIKARESKKIIKATDEEIRSALGYIMALLGENAARILDFADYKNPSCTIVINSLRRAFPHLKIEELKTAFDVASDGKTDVNLSLYNRTFNSEFIAKVINAYREFRKSAIVKEHKMLEAPKPEPSEEEKKKIVDDYIKEIYIVYKDLKMLPQPCAWIYQELENSGEISHSVEEKKQFYLQAQRKENKRLEELKKTSDFIGIKRILKEQEIGGNENKLKTIARELALKSHWDKQIEIDKF